MCGLVVQPVGVWSSELMLLMCEKVLARQKKNIYLVARVATDGRHLEAPQVEVITATAI